MAEEKRSLSDQMKELRETIDELPCEDEEGREFIDAMNRLAETLGRLSQGLEPENKRD